MYLETQFYQGDCTTMKLNKQEIEEMVSHTDIDDFNIDKWIMWEENIHKYTILNDYQRQVHKDTISILNHFSNIYNGLPTKPISIKNRVEDIINSLHHIASVLRHREEKHEVTMDEVFTAYDIKDFIQEFKNYIISNLSWESEVSIYARD